MKMEAFDRLYFLENYRQRYTVIPITTARGPYFKLTPKELPPLLA